MLFRSLPLISLGQLSAFSVRLLHELPPSSYKRNLITGTRDFNVKGMKQFEDRVYNYLKQNKSNHVMYRVTPYFKGENQLVNGVNIEAYSIEDNGVLHFNVYVYNVQDGIVIDYATGESKLAE